MNRRRFLATAATLPTLFQSCRPEQAMGQERDLSIGERIQRVDEAIRKCVLPDGFSVAEEDDTHVFPIFAYDTLTPQVRGFVLVMHYNLLNFGRGHFQLDASPLLLDAHLPSIDQIVERTLLDAVERFTGEA